MTVTPTEQIANTASTPKTGFFAMLGALLCASGTGAPKITRGSGASSRAPLAVAFLLTTLAALVFAAAPALALKEYVLGISFGEPCSGIPCGPGQLKEPSGVAVNNTTGDVYVVDQGDDRVEQYSSTGVFLAQFNGSAAPTGVFSSPEYVAVDNSGSGLDSAKEDVYVADNGHHAVDRFGPAGEYLGQLTGTCPAEGESQAAGKCAPSGVAVTPFAELDGIAVGEAGELWVHDSTGSFDEFTNNGEYTTSFDHTAWEQPGGLALDSEGNIYATFREAREATKLSPSGADEAEFAGPGVTGVAVASVTGDVLVDKSSTLELYGPIVEESGQAPIQRFATGSLAESNGVAVNSANATQTAYASERTADDVRAFNYVSFPTVTAPSASEVSNTVETLGGSVEPKGEVITGCRFEYGLVEAEPGHYEHSVSCEQEASSITGTSVSVSRKVEGLTPGETYHFRLDASNANGTGNSKDEKFTLFPGVGGESFSGVGSSSAVLHAAVLPGGVLTSYYFEYGTSTEYGLRTPVESAGAGTGNVSVEAAIEGLSPDTAYHFHVVASSANGVVGGIDSVFSTLPVGVLGLPDGRGYELVSSLGNGDASVVPEAGGRAAADGSRVAYAGQSPLVGGNGGSSYHGQGLSGFEGDNQYLATRAGSGWGAVDIQPEGIEHAGYQSFSSDLSEGILVSEQALLPGAPAGEGHGSTYAREESGTYRLLGENAGYAGSTPDGKQILVSQKGRLEEVEPETGRSYLISVLPEGGLARDAVFGAPPAGKEDLSNVISSDGSRVFWSEEEPLTKRPLRLFVSDGVGGSGGRTVQLDAAELPGTQKEKEEKGGDGTYWTSSTSGNKIYFTDVKDLTAGANAAPGEPDLYLYNLEAPEGQRLTDLTPATTNPKEEHANVVGVLGASSDGSYVYFAAAGSLAGSGATPQTCSPAEEGRHERVSEAIKCDVYALHDGEAPRLVAAVTNFDGEFNNGDWVRDVGAHSSFVSGDGRVLVFKSIESLTGFDSREDQEIYTYDYGAGLTCVSCNPAGAATVHRGAYAVDAELPNSGKVDFALRDLSASGGRVFFRTVEGLVPQDENGRQDVYEWERPGEGTCTVGGASYSAASGGCLFVLSGGTSTDESYFLDASENGDDVFIETRSDLVPRDKGEVYEVYDARVGATEPPAEPQCTGSGCQGIPAAPPIFATPSSVTFSGVGNFPAPAPVKKVATKTVKCAKGKTRNKRDQCVKKKKSSKTKKAKRASNDRRATR